MLTRLEGVSSISFLCLERLKMSLNRLRYTVNWKRAESHLRMTKLKVNSTNGTLSHS